MKSLHASRYWLLLGALLAGLVGGFTGGFNGGLFAWAEAGTQRAPDRIDQQWASYAADVASATGALVTYVPAAASALNPSATMGREIALSPSEMLRHGGVSVLRIGATSGPCVLVVPSTLTGNGDVGRAFEDAGLKEPRKLVQTIVMAAMRDAQDPTASSQGSELTELLRDFAIAVPVRVTDPERRDRPKERDNAREPDPSRNFPVRWEEAVREAPQRAGLYPGSHPRARALTSWLYLCSDCTHVVLVDPSTLPAGGSGHPPGSLGAFCEEGLGMVVHRVVARDLMATTTSALKSCCKLSFDGADWQQLGPANWALNLTLTNEGLAASPGTSRALPSIRIQATGGDPAVRLTAIASSGPQGEMELLPLQRDGVIAAPLSPGESRHLRLFFTSTGIAETPDRGPRVELRATSPSAKQAVITTSAASFRPLAGMER